MELSRLSEKGQVTIPKQIREAIGLQPGDIVAYEVQDQTITVKRIAPFDAAFHEALSETLGEWTSAEDDEAFHDL